jgi:hypothetical protein
VKITVVSSLYGAYDAPMAPVEQDTACDWVMVTDRPPLIRGHPHPWPWKVIEEPRPDLHPRLAAKVAKCRPDLYTDADVTVWVDAHFRIIHPGFVSWAVRSLGRAHLAQLAHPTRRSLTTEAALSQTLPKYRGMALVAQAAHYLEAGYPDTWGLWAAGLIVRRTSPQIQQFGDAWLAEQIRWTVQDQLSEPPLLYWHGLDVATLPGPLIGHWGFELGVHADGTR